MSESGFNPQIVGNEWKPRLSEVAVRLYDRHLGGSSFIVPPHQTGTLVVDGKIQGKTVGKQDLKSFWQRFLPFLSKKTTTQVYLARNGLISLVAIIPDGRSADGHVFHVLCNYQVEIGNVDRFSHHFFQTKDVVTTNDLEDALRDSVSEAVKTFLRNSSSAELIPGSSELSQRFTDEIERTLSRTAETFGLSVTNVMTPVFSSKSVSELIDKKRQRETELENLQEAKEYERRKYEIDKDVYELEREIGELEFDKSIDEVDMAARLEARKNEIKSKSIAQRLQVQEGIDRAVERFKESRKKAKERVEDDDRKRARQLEDETQLRNHLLATVEIARSEELADLKHSYYLKLLKHQGAISNEQLKQRQEAYAEQSKLMRKQLEDSLANRALKENADRTSILTQHEVSIQIQRERHELAEKIRKDKATTDLEIRKNDTNYNQYILDREQDRKLEGIRGAAEIQRENLESMHRLHMEKERHDAEQKLKLAEHQAKNRPKTDDEMKWNASPEQLRAAAEYELAKNGHSIKHAAEREADLKQMLQVLQQAQSQTPAQIAAMLQQQETLWKGIFDRLKDTGDSGLEAIKQVALEMSRNQKVNVQLPDFQPGTGKSSQEDILNYFKELLMAQARATKN
ncbi:MAG: hypothetical protein RLY14_2409 [Planctomycetota bacterium]|jgi:hypothetical protein